MSFWNEPVERKMFLEATWLTLVVRIITLFPLRIYLPWLKKNVIYKPSDDTELTLSRVVKTIQRIKKYFPLGTTCLIQSIITKKLLARRGITTQLHFGLSKCHKTLKAHAWVEYNNSILVGGKDVSSYAVLYII